MSFLFDWIYNGFSSILQFLGKNKKTKTQKTFKITTLSDIEEYVIGS